MESVLKRLGLGQFTDVFNDEKITPDIVCKMSLYDMRCVGLNDRTRIMKLRTACVSYGSTKPIAERGQFGGAPSFQISKETMEVQIDIGFKSTEIAQLLSVSESTVYRQMRVFGFKKVQFTDINEEYLTCTVKQTLEEFPKCGDRMLIEILRQKNIKILRYRLRDILHQHDEIGVAQRILGRLHRRVYHIQCPNYMWHVDTNHKLIRWCFVIAGAIDGFSRFVTVLHCLDNNRADSLLEVFTEWTERFGTPHRVRTDMGMENLRIADFMIEKRGVNGILTGKSTHNQRIERLWRDVYDGVLVHFYQLFSYMEDENILDTLNPLHVCALHYVYKDKINEKLNIWRGAWGTHRLRTVGTSPMRMWYSGIMNGTINTVDHNDGEHNPPNSERPVFQPDHPEISEESVQRLSLECPRNWVCPNCGINVYQRALSIISESITVQ